jgi:hypothetical protein
VAVTLDMVISVSDPLSEKIIKAQLVDIVRKCMETCSRDCPGFLEYLGFSCLEHVEATALD